MARREGEAVKPWKRDLAYIREVGPDEPRFDAAVQRVWDRCEELELENSLALELMSEPQRIRFHEIVASREALS